MRELGIRPRKTCPGCGSAGVWAECRPRPFDLEALLWLTHRCPDCGHEASEAVQPDRALSLLYHRQKGRTVDPGAFRAGWEDPTLMVRFRYLLHERKDATAGFISLHTDGRVVPAKGFGWSAGVEPAVARRLLERARLLRSQKDQVGKYEGYRFAVRHEDGKVIDRTAGFDWEMGVELNYPSAIAKQVSRLVRSFQALSVEVGFLPASFRRDVGLLFEASDPES